MKRSFEAEEANEIELKFKDGEVLNLAFNVKTLGYINDKEIGGYKKFIGTKSVPEQCAKVIYIAAKSGNNEITMKRARALTASLKPRIISEILREFQEGCMGTDCEDTQKKILLEVMKEIMKEN